jgi:ATP-dependent Clp protease ATP-binding subunit ClpA
MTAKQVAIQLLEDAGVNVEQLREEIEAYLERQPKVTLGDGSSQQKSMGRVLADVLQAAREIKSELKVSSDNIEKYWNLSNLFVDCSRQHQSIKQGLLHLNGSPASRPLCP